MTKFASTLARFFDDRNLFTRVEWADILGVSETMIAQWLNDEAFPSAEVLRRLRRTLEEEPDARWQFQELSLMALSEIAPHAKCHEQTLTHYMLRPLKDAFLQVLDTLPPTQKEEVLQKSSSLARQTRDN